ncbi:MAG: hypothetical protein ACLQVA_14535 [Candidatus Brocadiia bacterium]
MPAICLDVHAFQVRDGRFRCTPLSHHEKAERLERLQVEVRALRAQPAGAPVRQVLQDAAGHNIRVPLEAAALHDGARPVRGQLRVLLRRAPRLKHLLKIVNVRRQRLPGRGARGVQDIPLGELRAELRQHPFEPYRQVGSERFMRRAAGKQPVQLLCPIFRNGIICEQRERSRRAGMVREIQVNML